VIKVAQIQARVCQHYGISSEELLGHCRARRLSKPRQVAIYLSRKLTKQSSLAISRRFNRDHSTVLYAVQTIEADRQWDPALSMNLTAIAAGLIGGAA
jgi:chromosomal replication initiator protein